MNLADFLDKIEWEGGPEAAFVDYGLKAANISDITESEKKDLDHFISNFVRAYNQLQTGLSALAAKYGLDEDR